MRRRIQQQPGISADAALVVVMATLGILVSVVYILGVLFISFQN